MTEWWRPRPAKGATFLHWHVGPLELWARRLADEWQVATTRDPAREERVLVDAVDQPPEAAEWKRYAADPGENHFRLTPVAPDRPLIVRPEDTLVIPPGRNVLLFVSVPLWVQIQVGDPVPTHLDEYPTLILTNTWFGTLTEGGLCYGLRTRAKRSVDEVNVRPARALCPLRLRNASDGPLEFQRLCLRSQHLCIYRGSRHLWTNAASVTYRGELELSSVIFERKPPEFERAATLLAEAREPIARSFIAKTFDNLRALTHI